MRIIKFAGFIFLAVMVIVLVAPENAPSGNERASVPKSQIALQCENIATRKAKHRPTVQFISSERTVNTSDKGGIAVLGFTAKNAFGVADHFTAVCLYDAGKNSMEASVFKRDYLSVLRSLSS